MNRKVLSILSTFMFLIVLGSCKTVPKNDPNFLGQDRAAGHGRCGGRGRCRGFQSTQPTQPTRTRYEDTHAAYI